MEVQPPPSPLVPHSVSCRGLRSQNPPIPKITNGDRMKRCFGFLLVCSASLLFPLLAAAQFPARGGLDCNGLSKIQSPVRPHDICADFRLGNERGEDNGVYIGHDEPSVGFYSTAKHSGNNVQWDVTLPRERPLPATQSFENFITFCATRGRSRMARVFPLVTRTIPIERAPRFWRCSSIRPAFRHSLRKSAAI